MWETGDLGVLDVGKDEDKHVKAVGLAAEKPIADRETEEGHAKNRRVEFRVIGGECK